MLVASVKKLKMEIINPDSSFYLTSELVHYFIHEVVTMKYRFED